MIEAKIEAFINKHQLIKKDTTMLVGVSGGPDSVALLHFLWQRRELYGLQLIAVGIDHQLRKETSQMDMAYVKAICQTWGIPFETSQVDVVAYKQKHTVGTQLAARSLRYDVFERLMRQYDADYMALGHHGDDQIETMLMSLMRTTTLSGIKGIPYRRPFAEGEIIRPLLPLSKAEIEAYCDQHDIHPRIDESNFTTDYTRNELRLNVVPILKDKNHHLHQTTQQLSETIQEDEALLLHYATNLMQEAVKFETEAMRATISINCLIKQPVSLQRRVFRLTLNYLYRRSVPETISYTHEQIFLQLLMDPTSNKLIHFPKKLFIEKSYDVIHFYFEADQLADKLYQYRIERVPSQITLPNNDGMIIRVVDELSTVHQRKYTFAYPEAAVTFPLHIRHRKAGDRMSYEGLQGSKKVKDIFIDDKVPRKEREEMYILTDNEDDILWLIGSRKKAVELESYGPYILFEYVKSNNKGEN